MEGASFSFLLSFALFLFLAGCLTFAPQGGRAEGSWHYDAVRRGSPASTRRFVVPSLPSCWSHHSAISFYFIPTFRPSLPRHLYSCSRSPQTPVRSRLRLSLHVPRQISRETVVPPTFLSAPHSAVRTPLGLRAATRYNRAGTCFLLAYLSPRVASAFRRATRMLRRDKAEAGGNHRMASRSRTMR
ncbi:hypothetical protein B0H19DRAFT_578635 [Mycena capillaripes]|nr:hypothetical protein B0H19DRAFT_578635 [Mycena capillaripes]